METNRSQQPNRSSWLPTAASALCLALACTSAARAQKPVAEAALPAVKLSPSDDAAIRSSAAQYAKAFAAADAKAIAELWTADADYLDDLGREFHGRDAIAKHLAELAARNPGSTMDIEISSIRMLGPDVAVETGTARASREGHVRSGAKYTAVHVRRDGKWLVSSLTETPDAGGAGAGHLKSLAWLVGDWKSEFDGRSIESKYEWMPGNTFLRRAYNVSEKQRVTSSGVQIIGWDPILAQVVSWTFDSEGGHGRELWTRDGVRWEIEASSVLADGQTGMAKNILMKLDDNTFAWQSVERSLNDQLLPDTATVRLKRVSK